MGISLVLPTLNRTSFLIPTTKALLSDCAASEIIIVDQSDSVLAISDHFSNPDDTARIRYYKVDFKSLLKARNFGWQHAQNEKIIFCDDDVIIYPGYTIEHATSLDLPGVGIVAGGIEQDGEIFNPCSKPGYFNTWNANPVRNYSSRESCYTDLALGANISFKKNVAIEVGGFDENLERGAALYEETDFCLRAKRHGFKVFFNAHARLKHLAAQSGGCRTVDPVVYVNNLARNRSIIIMRHVPPPLRPFCFLYLFKLIIAYTLHHNDFNIFSSSLPCIINGIYLSSKQAACSCYGE